MLTIKELIVAYDSEPVLKGIDLQLETGCVHGIVGLNGAGKSTLFNSIYGFLNYDGEILWNAVKADRRAIGYLPTHNYFYNNITGSEYLSIFQSGASAFNEEAWAEILALPLNELVDTYSTGMKKKLALLSLLKQDKELLILDEPFNGIDLETSRILMLLLEKLRSKGKTILISSHILETLTNTCDFIHHLENGQIKNSYAKDELPAIEEKLFLDLEEKHRILLDKVL